MDPIRAAEPRTDPTIDPAGGAPPPCPSDVACALRQAARARYEAWASGTQTAPPAQDDPCQDFARLETHDFDLCVTERPKNPVLYLRESGDTEDVLPKDVEQGQIGDCSLLATLLALSRSPEGRAVIKNAIVENRNDQGQVMSYTVTLHEPKDRWIFGKTFSGVKITVDPVYAEGHAVIAKDGDASEVWPLVLEKAFAQYVGGYNKLNQGSTANVPMEALTGRPATNLALESYGEGRLERDLAAGKLVVLETMTKFSGPKVDGMIPNHAYDVTGTERRHGELYVTFSNPWGTSQPCPVPYAELGRWFSRVDVGSVR